MGSMLIATTDRSGLNLAQVGGNDIYKMLHQVQSVIELGQLGDDYVKLFAEPVDNDRTIDWYVEGGDKVTPVEDLPPEERKAILGRFSEMLARLQDYAHSLRGNTQSATYRNYADIIEKALTVPGLDSSLYAVDGQPVLVNWGFSEGENELVDGTTALIREIQAKIKVASADMAREKAQAEPEPEPKPEPKPEPEPEPQPEPEPALEPAPVQPVVEDKPAKGQSRSWLPAMIAGALILAAGAAAMWYFLKYKPDMEKAANTPDMSWLKGDVTAEGVLINENQEAVDLKLHFETDDGVGRSYIVEKGQTCEGNVTARPQPDNKVAFAVGELKCPNGNHYDPMTMICIRGTNTCAGTNRNGESWNVKVNFKGANQ